MLLKLIQKRLPLFVGLCFFGAMALVGYYTIVVSNLDSRPLLRLPVRLITSEGLQLGAKVFMQGVEVGSVGGLYYLELDKEGWPRPYKAKGPSYGQTVIAVLNLKRKARFYENYTLLMKHATVLSPKIVAITPGNAAKNTDPNNPAFDNKKYFAQIEPLTLSEDEYFVLQKDGILPKKAGQVLLAARNYDDPLYQIAVVLKENRRDIHAITSHLRDISAKLDRGTGSIARVVNDPVLNQELNGLLKTIVLLTADARKGSEDLRETQALINFYNFILTFTTLIQF